jgi:hypothetical protein
VSPSDFGEILKPFVFLDLFDHESAPCNGVLTHARKKRIIQMLPPFFTRVHKKPVGSRKYLLSTIIDSTAMEKR